MLKLFLCSALFTPVMIVNAMSAQSSEAVKYNTTSFEDAYVKPELHKLKNCESAALNIFFHDKYLEKHSAELLGESVKTASLCDDIAFIIEPITMKQPQTTYQSTLDDQVQELSLTLHAHGVEAKVAEAVVQEETDTMILNGRTAILKIIIGDGEAA